MSQDNNENNNMQINNTNENPTFDGASKDLYEDFQAQMVKVKEAEAAKKKDHLNKSLTNPTNYNANTVEQEVSQKAPTVKDMFDQQRDEEIQKIKKRRGKDQEAIDHVIHNILGPTIKNIAEKNGIQLEEPKEVTLSFWKEGDDNDNSQDAKMENLCGEVTATIPVDNLTPKDAKKLAKLIQGQFRQYHTATVSAVEKDSKQVIEIVVTENRIEKEIQEDVFLEHNTGITISDEARFRVSRILAGNICDMHDKFPIFELQINKLKNDIKENPEKCASNLEKINKLFDKKIQKNPKDKETLLNEKLKVAQTVYNSTQSKKARENYKNTAREVVNNTPDVNREEKLASVSQAYKEDTKKEFNLKPKTFIQNVAKVFTKASSSQASSFREKLAKKKEEKENNSLNTSINSSFSL
jgi:hypothetical protein